MTTGADDVTVVWVSPSEGRDDAASALREWARARGVVLVPPIAGSAHVIEVDPTLAERIEKELDRAREAIAALDADPAERALARAESLLREHPELPQAAWLRAEVHRRWATRFTRIEPRDEARAQAAWQEAEALDGGRVAGVGETAFPPRKKTSATLAVSGAGKRRLVVRLDGVEIGGKTSAEGATYALDVPAAEHHVVVTLDDDVVFASWVAIADTAAGAPTPSIPIDVGEAGACSAKTFARVVKDESGGVRANGVSCARWLAAIPAERRGAVLVARCEGDTCGPLLEWRVEASLGAGTSADGRPAKTAWPAWATWTMVGVGVVAVAVTTIVATGVLETRPVEQRFVAGGVKVE